MSLAMHEGSYSMSKQKPGPKPKPGERYPSGNLKPKKAEDVRGPNAFARLKEQAVAKLVDPRLGTEIGRLWIADGLLTAGEAAAAFHIAEVYGRYERLTAKPGRSVASPDYLRSFKAAIDPYARGDLETVARYERRVRRAVKHFERLQARLPNDKGRDLIEEVCVNDRPISPVHHKDLKAFLGALAQELWFIPRDEGGRKSPQRPAKDAVHLGQAAVDAIARRIVDEKATPTEYAIAYSKPQGHRRSITVWGVKEDGTTINRRIEIGADGVLGAAVDAAMAKAAEAIGMRERAP
jgi:hypothetical protein